jgi:hypothetical protein
VVIGLERVRVCANGHRPFKLLVHVLVRPPP